MTTGKELELERVAASLGKGELALAIGISRTTLWAWENAGLVDAERAQRVRDAIARLVEKRAAKAA